MVGTEIGLCLMPIRFSDSLFYVQPSFCFFLLRYDLATEFNISRSMNFLTRFVFVDLRYPAVELYLDVLPYLARTNVPLRTPSKIIYNIYNFPLITTYIH